MKNTPLLFVLMLCVMHISAQNEFITTWKTDNIGVSNDNQITIPTFPGETYNYTVDWGDNTTSTGVTGDIVHTYANPGIYTVKISGLFPRIYFHEGLKDREKILTIEQWGNNPWSSMVFAFSFCKNLDITNPTIDVPNLSQATNLTATFNHCYNFNGDVSNWDVSTINFMQVMFREARKFNQDLSSWDVSNVNNMISMFEGADDFDQSLGSWDISSLTNATGMFNTSGLSTANYDATLLGWATDSSGVPLDDTDDIPSNVTFDGGNSMYCSSIAERTDLEDNYSWTITDDGLSSLFCVENAFITTWKTDNPGDSNDTQITIPTVNGEIYNYTIYWGDGQIDTNVTGSITHTYSTAGTYTVAIIGMFPRIYFNGTGDKEKLLTIEQWGTNPWTSMQSAFLGCSNLNITNATIDTPNLSNVTNLNSMFNSCSNFNGDISNWDVSTVEFMISTFFRASSFNQDIGNWNVSNVESMKAMFREASSFNQDISGWNVSSVTSTQSMFRLASAFNQDISNWDVGSVTSMSSMFLFASAFNQDIGNWDVSSVSLFTNAFQGANSFDQNLENWDISSVTDMKDMFNNITLSTANYDLTIKGWATDSSGVAGDGIDDIPSGINFHGGNSMYCASEAEYSELDNTYSWDFTDGGPTEECIENAFITTWKTDNPGGSNDNQITIPTWAGETYDYTVYWGDGTMDTNVTGNITHTYATSGVYTVKIIGQFPRIRFGNTNANDTQKILTVEQWGYIPWTSMAFAFDGCVNLNITATDTPNLSIATRTDYMFRFCASLNADISQWDVSNIIQMNNMFELAPQSAGGSFDSNLGNWDISNVQFMSNMFRNAGLSTENYDATLIGWATDSSGIADDGIDDIPTGITFAGGSSMYCVSEGLRRELDTTYDWTIGDWGLDSNCNNAFITTWKTDNVGASADNQIAIPTFPGETYNYTVDWGDGNTDTGVTGEIIHTYTTAGTYTVTITGLFPRISFRDAVTRDFFKILTIEQWGNNNWTSMDGAFWGCQNLNITNTAIDIPNFFNVTNLNEMFSICGNFNGDVSNWNVGTIEVMSNLFSNSPNFNRDLSDWDVNKVTNMESMFEGATSFNQDLGDWDITNVGNMTDIFKNVTLSTTNYDLTLLGWATDASGNFSDGIDDIPSSITFHGGNSEYCIAEALWNELDTTHDWTITDAGLSTDCTNGFITTWKTDNTGASNDNQITIPILPEETYNYTVDWGDGNIDIGQTTSTTHTYANPGTYTVTITGLFPAIRFDIGSSDSEKLLTIEQWGDNPWKSMQSAFFGCANLNITNPTIDTPNLNNVSSLIGTFVFCASFNGDITNWDVSTITNMSGLFANCTSFNQDLGNWDVSKVTSMSGMFFNASSFNQDLGDWDISQVQDMTDMFSSVTLSTSNYDAIVMGWATDSSGNPSDGIDDIPSNVIFDGGNSMYCVAEPFWNELDTTYNWTISDNGLAPDCNNTGFITTWNVDNAINPVVIPTVFGETYNYTVDWGDGNVDTGVTGISAHTYTSTGVYTVTITGLFPRISFNGAEGIDKLLTIEQWGDNPWISMQNAFFGCTNLNITNPAIDAPNLSNVTSLNGMFFNCSNFNGDITNWDVSQVQDMSNMFRNATAFNQNIGSWDVSKVQEMQHMFANAGDFNQDIGDWDVSSVSLMGFMFENAIAFDQSLANWNLNGNGVFMNAMFNGAGVSLNNYDSTLIGWATDSSGIDSDGVDDIPSNVIFDGGNSTYCAAEEAWLELDITYNWTISDAGLDANCNTIQMSAILYLQGATLNPNAGEESLMRDDLRVAGLLPTTSPYADNLTCDTSVFNSTGNDAIVDWILVELRDFNDNTIVIDSQSALLQRDGDVVSTDGISSLNFYQPDGIYYVSVKHRNHLGIMGASPVLLNHSLTVIDFAIGTQTFGSHAQTTLGMPVGIKGMWAGNVNDDTVVQYSGTNPDVPSILSAVLNDLGNFLNFPTYAVNGYTNFDVDMDGKTQYTGTTPDTPFILQNVLAHPGNFLNFSTYQITEQLPITNN